MADRTFQVVIWGGTGFVGKLVAEHIARDYAVRILVVILVPYACDLYAPVLVLGWSGRSSSANAALA